MKIDNKCSDLNYELKNPRRNHTLRPLIVASMVALSITGAYAAEDLAPVTLADDDTKGTLDNLNGQEIPNTNPVENYNTSSAYTLTEVPAGADGAAPTGDNIITKFEYNASDGSFTPKYYQLNLKQTTYGEGNESYTVTLENSPVKDVIINVRYDNTNNSERITVTGPEALITAISQVTLLVTLPAAMAGRLITLAAPLEISQVTLLGILLTTRAGPFIIMAP